MHRRRFIATVGAGLSTAGCLRKSPDDEFRGRTTVKVIYGYSENSGKTLLFGVRESEVVVENMPEGFDEDQLTRSSSFTDLPIDRLAELHESFRVELHLILESPDRINDENQGGSYRTYLDVFDEVNVGQEQRFRVSRGREMFVIETV